MTPIHSDWFHTSGVATENTDLWPTYCAIFIRAVSSYFHCSRLRWISFGLPFPRPLWVICRNIGEMSFARCQAYIVTIERFWNWLHRFGRQLVLFPMQHGGMIAEVVLETYLTIFDTGHQTVTSASFISKLWYGSIREVLWLIPIW